MSNIFKIKVALLFDFSVNSKITFYDNST